jgi:hypothetical protein
MVRFYSAVIITSERALSYDHSCPGLYSALFFIYIQYQASKELGIDKRDVLLYALCILYILSAVTVALDVTHVMHDTVSKSCIDHYDHFPLMLVFFRSSIGVSAA